MWLLFALWLVFGWELYLTCIVIVFECCWLFWFIWFEFVLAALLDYTLVCVMVVEALDFWLLLWMWDCLCLSWIWLFCINTCLCSYGCCFNVWFVCLVFILGFVLIVVLLFVVCLSWLFIVIFGLVFECWIVSLLVV